MLKKIGIIASLAATLYGSSALAASSTDLEGARGTFRNINESINEAVVRAQNLYEENHGTAMASAYTLLTTSGDPAVADNHYLSILRVAGDYSVEIQLKDIAGTKDTASSSTTEVPVAKGLLGAKIKLIPIYGSGDEKITSWECITNTDSQVQQFVGAASTKVNTSSMIRDYTDNDYLSVCIYSGTDITWWSAT